MRTPITSGLLLATAFTLTACEAEGPVALDGNRLASPQYSLQTRPLVGGCDVVGTQFVSFAPPILEQISTAVCHISLLGRVELETRQYINVVTGLQLAEGTWTTPNGDLLYVTSVGTAVPTGVSTIRFSGVATIDGGTGRFSNATGTAAVNGTADTSAGTGSFTYRGTLQFDASDTANH